MLPAALRPPVLPAPVAPPLLNCRGRLLDLSAPVVMGIVNLTPDSFSDGGLVASPEAAVARVSALLAEGATIVDVGAVSSRPGAPDVSIKEELRRLEAPVRAICEAYPEALLSIDTCRTAVAERMLALGVHIINDIAAGADAGMLELAAAARAPIVLMHRQGTPATMQLSPSYAHVVAEVRAFLLRRLEAARAAGVADALLDPGFGFGKTLAHNYQLVSGLSQLATLGAPLLVGLSRKSMLTRALGAAAHEVGAAAAALHWQALHAGARVLRVHDVAPAVQLTRLWAVAQHPDHQPDPTTD